MYFAELPGVGQELRSIAKSSSEGAGLTLNKIYLDERFTKKALLSALKRNFTFVHIASHFTFSPGNEPDSFLLLGNSSVLPLTELKGFEDVFSGVEWLTLSACNTAAQQENQSGKEIEGFAELTQRLGAKAVIASLWTVADDSTAKLMEIFYNEMTKINGGKESSKTEALRRAQLALLKGTFVPNIEAQTNARLRKPTFTVNKKLSTRESHPRDAEFVTTSPNKDPTTDLRANQFSHPYFWAPFVLFGNWL